MPVRKIRARGGSAVGRFPSIKMGRMIAFESLLERDFLYLLDFELVVQWFEEQPLTIAYQDAGKTLHYTPDFHLIEADPAHPVAQHILVECKPERFAKNEENQRKFAVAQAWCAEQGWQFRVVTEQQIRSGCRLQNIQLLTRYARQKVESTLSSQILSFLAQSGRLAPSLQQIAAHLLPGNPQQVTACLLHMAYHHQIHLPLDAVPISGTSLVVMSAQAPKEVQP